VRRRSRHHHEDAIGSEAFLLQRDGAIDGAFADGDGGQLDAGHLFGDALARADRPQQLIGVGELRHPFRIAEVRDFDAAIAGEDQFLGDPQFRRGGNPFLFVLEPVADRDVSQLDALRKSEPAHEAHVSDRSRARAASTVKA